MSSTTGSRTEPPKGASTDEIERHIEQTRHELGQTLEALSHKLDVKAQAQERMTVARQRAGEVANRVKDSSRSRWPVLVVAGVTVAAGAAFVLGWKRKH